MLSVCIFTFAYWSTVAPIGSIFVRLHLLSQQNVIFGYECINILVPNNFYKERTCQDTPWMQFFSNMLFFFKNNVPSPFIVTHRITNMNIISDKLLNFRAFVIIYVRDIHISLTKTPIK